MKQTIQPLNACTVAKESVRLVKQYPEVRALVAHNYLQGAEQVALLSAITQTLMSKKIGWVRKSLVVGSIAVAYAMSYDYRITREVNEQFELAMDIQKRETAHLHEIADNKELEEEIL